MNVILKTGLKIGLACLIGEGIYQIGSALIDKCVDKCRNKKQDFEIPIKVKFTIIKEEAA